MNRKGDDTVSRIDKPLSCTYTDDRERGKAQLLKYIIPKGER